MGCFVRYNGEMVRVRASASDQARMAKGEEWKLSWTRMPAAVRSKGMGSAEPSMGSKRQRFPQGGRKAQARQWTDSAWVDGRVLHGGEPVWPINFGGHPGDGGDEEDVGVAVATVVGGESGMNRSGKAAEFVLKGVGGWDVDRMGKVGDLAGLAGGGFDGIGADAYDDAAGLREGNQALQGCVVEHGGMGQNDRRDGDMAEEKRCPLEACGLDRQVRRGGGNPGLLIERTELELMPRAWSR